MTETKPEYSAGNESKPFSEPNYTQFSNDAIDLVMRDVSPNAWKVITVAIRKTSGWHKKRDVISYSQFQELTGIKSRTTLSNAIKEVVDKNILIKSVSRNSFSYELNRDYVVQKSYQYRNCTEDSTETVPVSCKNGTETVHTKESIKEKERNSADAGSSLSDSLPIDWAIAGDRPVKSSNIAASNPDSNQARLSTWHDVVTPLEFAVCDAVVKAYPQLTIPRAYKRGDKLNKSQQAERREFHRWMNDVNDIVHAGKGKDVTGFIKASRAILDETNIMVTRPKTIVFAIKQLEQAPPITKPSENIKIDENGMIVAAERL